MNIIGFSSISNKRARAAGRMISQELGLNRSTSLEELTAILGHEKDSSTWTRLSSAVYGETITAIAKDDGNFLFKEVVESIMQTVRNGKYTKPKL